MEFIPITDYIEARRAMSQRMIELEVENERYKHENTCLRKANILLDSKNLRLMEERDEALRELRNVLFPRMISR